MSEEALLYRLDAELYRVANEAMKGDLNSRGMMHRRGLEGVDIYGHPEALMHFRAALEPHIAFDSFHMRDPKTMPPGAIGKYRDCWVFADVQMPEGSLIIRLNGKVYSDVPVSPSVVLPE